MRFGIAVRDITPPFPTPMYGYGMRKDMFDDVNDPLTFTALVLAEGRARALIGAADLCTFPNDGRTPELMRELARILGCPLGNIMLNASHTHGGPQLPTRSLCFRDVANIEACAKYEDFLFQRVIEAVREAKANLREGSLWFGEGKTSLPMNRRLERDGRVQNAPNPNGPVDDRLQLLLLRNDRDELVAVGMRASCHPVATGAQHRITADYPGAWRAELRRAFNDRVIPFFLQGAGADARPRHVAEGDHWRQMKHAELPLIGRELLADSLAILATGKLRQLERLLLRGTIRPVEIHCEPRYTRKEHLQPLLQSNDRWERLFAEECLKMLERGEPIPQRVTFHVQTLWLDRELALIGLDAEPLCGLGRFVEFAVSPRSAMLLGYVNGCIAYTPDSKEMARGGYETEDYLFEPWTGPMRPGIERHFACAVVKLPAGRK